jgi:hypothetical protein
MKKVPIYYNLDEVLLVTNTLYAKYPSKIPHAFQTRSTNEIRTEGYLSNNFFRESLEISDALYSVLNDSFKEKEFHFEKEVEAIFDEYSQKAREKTAAKMMK